MGFQIQRTQNAKRIKIIGTCKGLAMRRFHRNCMNRQMWYITINIPLKDTDSFKDIDG